MTTNMEIPGIDIREIVKKLGHQLEEIRLRALENILSKLRNQIIFTEDLIHHRDLIVNLLEWFNHEERQKIGDVLGLLENLAKHGAAASVIQSLGGVEFLSRLRHDLTDSDHLVIVDSILNNLFWIHTEEEEREPAKPASGVITANCFDNHHLSHELDANDRTAKSVTTHCETRLSTNEGISSYVSRDRQFSDVHLSKENEATREASLEESSPASEDEASYDGSNVMVAEWIVLTSSDRHILSVTESRLQSHNSALVSQSCEFFRDVLLQDFPTHIFIQRPNIVQTLLHLLEVYSGKNEELTSILLSCLTELTEKLRQSTLQQQSPDLVQLSKVKEIYSSTESSVHTEISSLHSRTTSFERHGDTKPQRNSFGKDFGSTAGSDPEDFESELLTEALHQSQWTGLDYCLHVTPGAVTFMINAIQAADKSDDGLLLLNSVLNLLCLYDVKIVWDTAAESRKVYDIMTCLRNISGLIQLSLDAKNRFATTSDNASEIESIHAYHANVTAASIRFINLTVPQDRENIKPEVLRVQTELARSVHYHRGLYIFLSNNKPIYEAVPESLLESYKTIFTDEILAQGYPHVRSSLHLILQTAEEPFYENIKAAEKVISSMRATKRFMDIIESKESTSMLALLDICERSLLSVEFHHCELFIKFAVNLASDVSRRKDGRSQLLPRGKSIVLRLLSNECDIVKEMAYQICLDIVTDALSISHVTDPVSTVYQQAAFMIDSDILFEVICFGIESEYKKITHYSVNILVTLLLGRLNMSPHLWKLFIDSLIPVLPLVQCFAAMDRAFERALVNISDASNALLTSDGDIMPLPPLEQMRASFRYMLVRDVQVRAKGFSSVLWLLTQEDSKHGNATRYPFDSGQNAADMFLVDPAISAKYHKGAMSHSGFIGSNLENLWGIFISQSVELSLKESAAEQLAVLLQDKNLHKQLLDLHAERIIMETLHLYVKQVKSVSLSSVDTNPKMLLTCVTMLRQLVQHNATVRHTLAVEKSLYLDCLKCRIVCNDMEQMHYESSCLIALLVFDEYFKKDGDELSLPRHIVTRYILPTSYSSYDLHSKCSGNGNDINYGILREEPFWSMIRINWNIIHAGKAENVMREKGSNYDHSSDSNQLHLTNQEVRILQDLLPMKCITRHVNILKHSENTNAILNAIEDMRKYILSSICRRGMHAKDTKTDSFHNSFQILLDTLADEMISKRLLFNTIHKSKTSALKRFFQFCRLLNAPNSGVPDEAALHILKHMLEEDSPVVAAITNYTMLRARQAGLARTEQDSYDLSNEDRALFKEILRLVSGLCHKIHSQPPDGYNLPRIGDFISLILQSLSKVESSSYYDLPVLEITVDCLCHITYSKGWSMQYTGSGEQLCNSIADIFIQILRSFHVDRIGAATSFMGKGVMTKAALCLCHVAKEFQIFCGEKDWTVGWITRRQNSTADDLDGGFPWLLPLLTDRVLDIRWSGWSLATALMNGPLGAENIVNEFQVFPGGVWASAVGVILDDFENPLVRSQACKLLSSSLSTLLQSREKEGSLDLWSSMIVQDTQSKANISGFPAFMLLLDHFHFFKKIKEHLSQQSPPQRPLATMTALHNVSTSCTTPSSDTNQHYERISGESDECQSEIVSVGAQSDGNQSREGSVAKTDGSSYERLLLSHADSLSQSSKDEQDKVYRLSISRQDEKQWQTKEITLPRYCTARMKSSLFQFIFQIIRVDAETVIANLENEGIIETLVRCLDQNFLTGFISCCGNGKFNSKRVTSFIENAEASKHLLALINVLFTKHAATKDTLPNDVQFLRKLISYFQLPNLLFSEFTSFNTALFSLWNESIKILIKMCTCSQNAHPTTAENEVVKELQFFAVACQYSRLNGKTAQHTLILLLTLMRSIFCREGRRNKDSRILCQTLDAPCLLPDARKREERSCGTQTTDLTLGQYLTWLLLELSSTSLDSGPERKSVMSTLSSLFVVSASAKVFALENGFLESIIEEIKDVHVKLNLASLQLEKDSGDKRKEKVLRLELAEIFDSLRNFMHDSVDMKEAAIKSSLVASVQKMWSWCMIDKALKAAVLELLVTLTAGCEKAQEILCHGGSTNQKANQEDNALFQSIMKLIVRQQKDCMAPTGKIDASTRIVFQLVTNLAASSSCRCMIWKNNLYQHFGSSQVSQSANKKQKVASKIMTALWLQLLLVVSFYVDGAQMILKVNGVLPTLISIASEEQHRERRKALLILRNLLFFPTNKPSLVTNDLLTSCLIKSLDTRSIWTRAIVVSCFASLLHNCHKAKVTLKRTKLLPKLHLLNEELVTGKMLSFDGKTKGYDQLKVSLQMTLKILSN